MTRDDLIAFLAGHTLGVVATIGPDGEPQAALVALAVTDGLELVFDTVSDSRKVQNLRRDPRVALVVGGSTDDERTVQCEGIADEPSGEDGERIRAAYLGRYPDGKQRLGWPGITHVRVRLQWLRFTDFNQSPPLVVEVAAGENGELDIDHPLSV